MRRYAILRRFIIYAADRHQTKREIPQHGEHFKFQIISCILLAVFRHAFAAVRQYFLGVIEALNTPSPLMSHVICRSMMIVVICQSSIFKAFSGHRECAILPPIMRNVRLPLINDRGKYCPSENWPLCNAISPSLFPSTHNFKNRADRNSPHKSASSIENGRRALLSPTSRRSLRKCLQ